MYIKYLYDEFEGGYLRQDIPINTSYIQAVTSGQMFAHDFVEHPKGYPTGTLEDEIAAFGTIIGTRYKAGLIRGFMQSPDRALANELIEMLDVYRKNVKPELKLKPKNKYWKSNEIDLENIADLITENPTLNKRLVAWFQYGITKANQRFNNLQNALSLYLSIESAIDNLMYDRPYTFTLKIKNYEATIPEHLII